jgi:hypothetical protein
MSAPEMFTRALQSLKLIRDGPGVDGDDVGEALLGRGLVGRTAGLPLPPVLTEQAARLAAQATTADAASPRRANRSRRTR